LLDHLTEAGVYSPKDLESIQNTLGKIDEVVKKGKESYSPHIVKLLEGRVHACRGTLSQLYEAIVPIMSPQFEVVHEKLVSILRSIAAANTRQKVNSASACRWIR
jgi:cob(I)alamin adenosyltransferase